MIPNSVMQLLSKINPKIQGLNNVQTPDEMAQMLLNSGVVNQQQVNHVRNMWNQPDIRQQIQQQYKY